MSTEHDKDQYTERRTESSEQPLLRMTDIRIEGFSDEQWHPIIKGVDLTLRRGKSPLLPTPELICLHLILQ